MTAKTMTMKNTKNSFNKFAKRNTHKRRDKTRALNELRRAVEATGVALSPSASLRAAYDSGRRGRSSASSHRDECVAEGIFTSSRDGFGFVAVEGEERDVFIPEDRVGAALDGDLVEVVYHKYQSREGQLRTEGRIAEVLRRERECIIGTLYTEYSRNRRGYYHRTVLIPDDPRLPIRPEVTDTAGAMDGDKVQIKLRRADRAAYHTGYVVAVFGQADSPLANYEAILAECDIPMDFSADELSEAERLSAAPISTEGRCDKRDEMIFTIDGADAKDLDDAVSVKRVRGGWSLGVHIADVSEYVPPRTPLDRAVMRRGTSVYFTDRVVPMLPPALSNGACSLNPDTDKYALSATVGITDGGEIRSVKIEPSIIRSRVRGVYSEVNAIFDGTADGKIREKYSAVIPTLLKMRELYRLLLATSKRRGSIDMEIPEARIILDEEGRPTGIERRERGDAERMIEQFMLAANEAVATYLHEQNVPCVYRIHEPPSADRLRAFSDYARSLGLDTSGINKEGAESRDFAKLLSGAEEKGLLESVSGTMLRSMSKAEYSDVTRPHFGLGIKYYCHFTSPIRRLSDLATHRIIHRVLLDGERAEKYSSYAKRAAAAATETEQRALKAERKIENLYKVIYMSDFIGQRFEGVVDSVASFGIFVRLENTCDGLVPAGDMGFTVFDERSLTLRAGGRQFSIGDKVSVILAEADITLGKLRFSLCD